MCGAGGADQYRPRLPPGCAHGGHALDDLPLAPGGVVFIENVGNLVCPAAFDLGEACKVVILSVTEGEDKPIKYPDMFAAADLMLLSKTDLLPHVDFDPERALEYARRVNPAIAEIRLSARSGEGMAAWLDWIRVPGFEDSAAAKESDPDPAARHPHPRSCMSWLSPGASSKWSTTTRSRMARGGSRGFTSASACSRH